MQHYGVGRVTPGYEINDNPATTGRSLGYGAYAPPVRYGSDSTTWVQEDPASLKLKPLPPEGRISPDFADGRMMGYGVDLPPSITQYYPGFLKTELSLPIVGGITLGTTLLTVLVTYFVLRRRK